MSYGRANDDRQARRWKIVGQLAKVARLPQRLGMVGREAAQAPARSGLRHLTPVARGISEQPAESTRIECSQFKDVSDWKLRRQWRRAEAGL
jgi:hypothetical protein